MWPANAIASVTAACGRRTPVGRIVAGEVVEQEPRTDVQVERPLRHRRADVRHDVRHLDDPPFRLSEVQVSACVPFEWLRFRSRPVASRSPTSRTSSSLMMCSMPSYTRHVTSAPRAANTSRVSSVRASGTQSSTSLVASTTGVPSSDPPSHVVPGGPISPPVRIATPPYRAACRDEVLGEQAGALGEPEQEDLRAGEAGRFRPVRRADRSAPAPT